MRFRFNCLLIAVTCLTIWAGGLIWTARAEVVQGSYSEYICDNAWDVWAINAGFYNRTERYYIIAHGAPQLFRLNCGRPDITPDQINGYNLGFFAGCDAMCSNADHTFAESVPESVGYCNMSESSCDGCWMSTVAWQDAFYRNVDSLGAGAAYNAAMNAVPSCLPCLRYHKKRTPEQVNETQIVMTTIIVPWLMRKRK